MDDSIVRVMLDRELVLRRARGYAPLPIQLRSAECGCGMELAGTLAPPKLRTPNSELRTPKLFWPSARI